MGDADNAIEVLRAARELLSDESRWTQGAAAIDSRGCHVGYAGTQAVRWCIAGATGKVACSIRATDDDANEALEAVLAPGFESIPDFNDDPRTTHADVLALFSRAIAKLESAARP